MSVYNGAQYLQKSLNSVLQQTYKDFEFIIVNDASTDETSAILNQIAHKEPRIEIINNEENLGLTNSLNKGLAIAKGEYIARMDADDISLPNRLHTQVNFLEQSPEVGLIGSAYHIIDKDDNFVTTNQEPLSHTELAWKLHFRNAFCHSSVMFRKKVLNIVGLYNPDYRQTQDYELWARIARVSVVKNTSEPLIKFRQHGSSITQTQTLKQQRNAENVSKRELQLTYHYANEKQFKECLSKFYPKLPHPLPDKSLKALIHLFKLLFIFKNLPSIQKYDYSRILKGYYDRFAEVTNASEWFIKYRPVVFLMLRKNPALFLSSLIRVKLFKYGF